MAAPGSMRAAWVRPWRWPWPLPAVSAWVLGWLLWSAALAFGATPVVALALGLLGSAAVALSCQGWWRRGLAAAGFPVSALVLGAAAGVPAWLWLLLVAPLVALYPLRAWRDAPLFPTPAAALHGLRERVEPAPHRVLDAGCGLGHGLDALRGQWPQAELHGVEWSPLLATAAAWRCPEARVRHGDLWALDWSDYDLIYLFQRPESMIRAWDKARRELRPGAWVVSLDFPVHDVPPWACLQNPGQRTVWVYRQAPAKPPSIGVGAGR